MRNFARMLPVLGALCLTAGTAPAQSLDIPLNLTLQGTNDPGPWLTINIGINGAAPRPYIFDTGSEIFVAQYTSSAFGNISSSSSTLPQGQQILYGNGTYGYNYNIVGTPSLTFYPTATSTTGGVTLNAVSPSGAASQFQIGAITSTIALSFPDGTLPGVYAGGYGVFGASNFLQGGPGGVLGQAVIPGTTAGYVVAANGQPLSAMNAGSYATSSPNGPQVSQSVTACSPCVMLGLTPALIAQFEPVNVSHTPYFNVYGTFANSGAPASIEYPLSWNISVNGLPAVASRTLLDTGTGFYQITNAFDKSDYINGGATLTVSGPNSGSTPNTVSLIANNVPYPYADPYYGKVSGTETILGLPFFLNNSVLYNLTGEAIGYTSNFVTDVNLATTTASPLVIDSNSVPLGLAGIISGSGQLQIVNGGAATLSGTSTYTGVTVVNNGFLALVGPGSISTSSGVSISNYGVFDVSGVGSGTPSGAYITSLSSTDSNGLVLLGANALVLTSANGTFAGTIADGGSYGGSGGALVLAGGIETLAGINTYTGGTWVDGGTLNVTGLIGAATVNAGGVLMGSGTVGATQVNAGGTLAPGNGTTGSSLTIVGNLAFQSGAIYLVQVGASASFATVTGTATLNGATFNAVFGSGSSITKQYTILTASGGINGSFAAVSNTNPLAGFLDGLSYAGNNVYLNLTAVLGRSTALNQNQQNVATALNNYFNNGSSLPPAFAGMFGLTGAYLANVLAQASGELGTGSQQTTFDAMGLFMGVLTDPFMSRTGGANSTPGASGYAEEGDIASAYAASKKTDAFAMFTKAPPAPFVQRWSVWAAGFGGSQTTDGNAATGSNNTTSNIYGTAVGADYLFSPNTLAGFALAGGGTNFSVNGMGSGRSDLFQAGAYVRHTEGPAYISAALAYGWQDITTNRTVTIAGIDQLRAEFDANAYSGRIEGGYRFVAPWTGGVGITPYAAGQFTTFDLPAYAESAVTGTPNFVLAYAAKDVTDARSELGIRTDKSYIVEDGILTLRARLAWAHDFDPDRSIVATFQALPGASFVVNGAAQASDSALTTASIEMKWKSGWSAAATFEGEFSDVTTSYAGKGVVRYVW
jgi:uncharacterized protein with beta-barrel porin domain